MVLVKFIKLKNGSKLFRQGQRVWIQQETGQERWRVIGKYQGRGRYVSGWVNVFNEDICEMWVDVEFATSRNLLTY